jgi:hypothetical protein
LDQTRPFGESSLPQLVRTETENTPRIVALLQVDSGLQNRVSRFRAHRIRGVGPRCLGFAILDFEPEPHLSAVPAAASTLKEQLKRRDIGYRQLPITDGATHPNIASKICRGRHRRRFLQCLNAIGRTTLRLDGS